MLCENCRLNNAEVSAIIKGVYYSSLCKNCQLRLNKAQLPSSGHARWARDIDLQDHEADIQQPWGKDGKPNKAFIKLYPKQARAVFSEKQMRDANR